MPLHLTPMFSASPERLFDAWTQPDLVERWLFKSDNNSIERVTIDLKCGGKFSILERADGETVDHFGEYFEIDRPHRLAFTLEVPSHFQGVSRVAIEFKPHTQGCEMDFKQDGVDPSLVEGAWRMMFTGLARVMLLA